MFGSFRGDYRGCDLPYWTAEAIIQYIASVEKVIGENLFGLLASNRSVFLF
jgi:hypothetical protein